MTERPPLPAAGAVQDAPDPFGEGLSNALSDGLVAGLPSCADADMQVGGLPVIDGGPASGPFGLIHATIIGSNKCVDKYPSEVFNVNTLNQESDMETSYLYRIPQPGDHVFAGRILFYKMNYGDLMYRVASPTLGHYLHSFSCAVEAQNFADENNLEYFGVNDEHPHGCICGLIHAEAV